MKQLSDFKEELHSCSKCGLCQSVCPLYQVTGNDCTVSRGQFIMLRGITKGELKMNRNINKYLNMCLKCGACSKFCPSDLDVVDIIITAKAEYFKQSTYEHFISFIQKNILLKFVKFAGMFSKKVKSKSFSKKVIYFGGCGNKFKGNSAVVNILNKSGIEVITPNFDCCGILFLTRGDLDGFKNYIENFVETLKKYNDDEIEIVTTCASCEKVLKDYPKYSDNEFLKKVKIKNIYEYLRENNIVFELKKPTKVTFHKPCNISNYDDIKLILENTKNLEYVEMKDYDKCCGLNGIANFNEYKTMLKIYDQKRKNILETKAKFVLTSCLGCETALLFNSLGMYRVCDLTDFLNKNIK